MTNPGAPCTGIPEVRRPLADVGSRAELRVARQLSDLARSMQAEPNPERLLYHIVRAAVSEIPGAAHAGIIQIRHGRASTAAATSDLVFHLDQVQYAADDGPCLTAGREHVTVLVEDMGSERRWSAFVHAAIGSGIASMLSLHLFVQGSSFGALNIYAQVPHAFDRAEVVGLLFASHCAVAMAAARQVEDLKGGLSSRDVIGQAKGILMERHRITAGEAFDLLTIASQHSNRKLRDVAARLVETGELPDHRGEMIDRAARRRSVLEPAGAAGGRTVRLAGGTTRGTLPMPITDPADGFRHSDAGWNEHRVVRATG